MKKKLVHRFSESKLESLALEGLKQRWREQCAKYEANCREEMEEREDQKKEHELHLQYFRKYIVLG